jgi:hypothetical protein
MMEFLAEKAVQVKVRTHRNRLFLYQHLPNNFFLAQKLSLARTQKSSMYSFKEIYLSNDTAYDPIARQFQSTSFCPSFGTLFSMI